MKFLLVPTVLLAGATAGQAATVGFNNLSHGDVVTGFDVLGITATVSADGNSPQSPDIAVAFDTSRTGTADPDLEGTFTNGIGRTFNAKRALIIQENPNGGPDDDGLGGVITMQFSSALDFLGFTILDDANITVTSDLGHTLSASVAEDNMFKRVRTNDWIGISRLTFDFGNASGAIDNLRFDVPAEVPVPASLPLLAGGLAALGWGAKRRRG